MLGLWAEQIVRALWPLWAVVLFGLAMIGFGVSEQLPLEALWAFWVVFVLGLLFGAFYAWRHFRKPVIEDAYARLDDRLPGRPFAALTDQQIIGATDPSSQAIWARHQERMRADVEAARAVEPDLRLSARDPYGIRYIALLAFAVALLFGTSGRLIGSRGVGAISGNDTALIGADSWEGWITPPAYTGLPTLYLADQPEGRLAVPQGSEFVIRLYGEPGDVTLDETVSARAGDDVPPATAQEQSFQVTQDGHLIINGTSEARWQVEALADSAPEIELLGPIEVDSDGVMSQPFVAMDDYGVERGTAEFTLATERVDRRYGLATEPEPRAPIIVDLPLPFSGERTDFEAVLTEDFSKHPFANLPVTMVLSATDAAEQMASTSSEPIVLPGRRFFEPRARSVIELRRDLLWSRENARRVSRLLKAVSYAPEDLFKTDETYLRIRQIIRDLDAEIEAGLSTEKQDEIAEAMWDLAIYLEEGTLADAQARLERAQERLAEAMRNGASQEEIQELMQELRDATDDYIDMLAERAEPQEGTGTDEADRQRETLEFSQNELDALMDEIQRLMEEGKMAEAQALMEQLNQLMENMQITQGQGGEGRRRPGQQSMDDMADTLEDQQELSDDAFRELQEQAEPGGQNSGEQPSDGSQSGNQQGDASGQEPGGSDEGGTSEQSLAERQEALRRGLENLVRNLPSLSGEAADATRDAIDRADKAMRGAEEALRDENFGEALDQQAEALDALREGLRNLNEALADNQADQNGAQEGGQRAEGGETFAPTRRDPLGREMGSNGRSDTDQNMIGESEAAQAQELLDEIRRRSGEQERPEDERTYLRRLLDRF